MNQSRALTAVTALSTTLMFLTACGGGSDGIDGAVWVNKGQVVDAGGTGINDVNVSVVLDKTYSATTDTSGNYELRLPKEYAYPTHFSGLATKQGIVPYPVFFTYESGKLSFINKTTTRAVQESDILFQSSMKVIHLGDSNYTGSSNSQFQFPNATGTVWSETATLSAAQSAKYTQLCISFFAKGIDDNSPNGQSTLSLSRNGQPGTYINQSIPPTQRDGSYSAINNCFSLQTFKAEDVIRVQLNSLPATSGDFDDFEFIAVTGVLK
ncbi:carboxypeptidase regulatory-like domain-containing protein [Diaphorobacter sp. HDW4A]|uniref:carboxypeptidase-like regulatory domain-containing protein n=1 Tax=Diaphorobacter sp. HDW4A TaxID=2714924 RepID=UPI00140E78EF|nr:carboxypeptidase-like regulatory domain-containing protein [Diaphorobacter sp. HDW4A]QIL83449.1 carboxypeptidase regulatory-like domain-containing protein [Diaphorobacter sp. HDW4A]